MKEYIVNGIRTIIENLQIHPIFQNPYILSAFILLITIIIAKLVMLLFKYVFKKATKRTNTVVDDLIIEKIEKPVFVSIILYGLKIAVFNITTSLTAAKLIDSVMAAAFIWILIRVGDIIIEAWGITFAKKTKSTVDDVLLPLFHKIVSVIFMIVGLMWILRIWGIDITPYLAGAGIIGIVLGLALQDSLKNVLGGITLILDRTYKNGDKIQLDDGTSGTIHEVGLRSTKLITVDNELVYIPNGILANTKVQNFTRPTPKVRVKVEFGVEYGVEVAKVKKVVLEVVKRNKEILSEPAPNVEFTEMGDFALKFRAVFWVADWNMAWGKKIEMTEEIYNALNKAKIGIPFPTQTVYLRK